VVKYSHGGGRVKGPRRRSRICLTLRGYLGDVINLSPFRYASLKVGFGSAGSSVASSAASATSKIQTLMATSVSGASSSSPFESAAQDQISSGATLAAQAAIARINKQRKTQSESLLKQIDGAQASIDKANTLAKLKQKYYVYTLPPVVLVDTTATATADTGTTVDTEA
jgi:hypothetical protein